MTTIQLLDVSDPPAPPPPLNPRVAVFVIATLVIGGGILAALAGPESGFAPDGPAELEPAPESAEVQLP